MILRDFKSIIFTRNLARQWSFGVSLIALTIMAKLSTHVLDTLHGGPAAGMALAFYAFDAASPHTPILRAQYRTNADGRTNTLLLSGDSITPGRYRLVFHVADYFRSKGVALPEIPFLDVVTVDFGIDDAGGNYHVPLVCTPWTYSTYRGS